jgi:hypothetical protein
MKLQRPGFTETTLMFCEYLKNLGVTDKNLDSEEDNFILWLYKSAGWYDMSLPCKGLYGLPFHNLPYRGGCEYEAKKLAEIIKNSYCYGFWKERYHESITDCDFLIPCIHKIKQYYIEEYKNGFIESLNPKNIDNPQFSVYWCKYESLYKVIKNKKVLVISCFADLIKNQYDSGNVHKIYQNFPELVSFKTYTFPYTFFNSGPLANSIETLNAIWNDIRQTDFEVAIISGGCYSCLLADLIHKDGRIGISMGRNTPNMFGVNPENKSDFWINKIPEKYIPEGFKYIDSGHYWLK